MSEGIPRHDDWLLDEQFDQLSPEDRVRLKNAVERDGDLATRGRRLQEVLEPLDSWSTTPPPESLVGRILDRIAAHEAAAPVVPVPAPMPGEERAFPFRPPASLKELLALAAVITLFFALFVPGMSSVRDRSRRIACATNLGQIGRALGGYATANDNALPFVQTTAGGSWLPANEAGLPYSPNSPSRFLLLRLGYVSRAQAYICPSHSDGLCLEVVNPQALNDFPDPRNCSYDSLNMAGATPAYSKLCNLPYMSDANPLFAGGKFNRIDPAVANSLNHRRGRGQNVLCLNGTVTWHKTPNCGRNQDNIWQAGSVTVYQGTEAQTRDDDTFLTP